MLNLTTNLLFKSNIGGRSSKVVLHKYSKLAKYTKEGIKDIYSENKKTNSENNPDYNNFTKKYQHVNAIHATQENGENTLVVGDIFSTKPLKKDLNDSLNINNIINTSNDQAISKYSYIGYVPNNVLKDGIDRGSKLSDNFIRVKNANKDLSNNYIDKFKGDNLIVTDILDDKKKYEVNLTDNYKNNNELGSIVSIEKINDKNKDDE